MKTIVALISLIAVIAASDLQPMYQFIKSTDEKIVGGEEAAKNSIPYQVGLFIYADDKRYFCGGSLISKNCVLTAAHCIKARVIEVILGAHNINEIEENQIRLNTTNFIVHEDFDSKLLINDIALIILDEEIELNEYVGIIKLPSLSESEDFAGKIAMISGWGKTSDEETTITDKLHFVEAPIITNEVCYEEFWGGIEASHICMEGVNEKSSCNGDSGGPLVYEGKLIGCASFIISFGCEAGFPSAYTRITSFLQWISQHSGIILEN